MTAPLVASSGFVEGARAQPRTHGRRARAAPFRTMPWGPPVPRLAGVAVLAAGAAGLSSALVLAASELMDVRASQALAAARED